MSLHLWHTFRPFFAGAVVVSFLFFVFISSIIDQVRHIAVPTALKQPLFPDFTQYKYLQTLPSKHFPIANDRRIIAIGDIHGMNDSLTALLKELSYDSRSDTLIHLGDLVTKDKVQSSPVLTFMSTNNILGVRGNNDQKVIEWRAWMDWIVAVPGGREWLEDVDGRWSHVNGDLSNTEFDAWLKSGSKRWQDYVPEGWKLLGKHYKVARDMSRDHYDYLRSLPLVLYAPLGHTYFVHAGLLPADPTRKLTDPKQPLSHWPTKPKPKADILTLRGLQERALLKDIPQNRDAWVLMNMRSLTKNGKVSDGKKDTPWSDLWNDVMGMCSGMDALEQHSASKRSPTSRLFQRKAKALPCFPSMVLYGHAAARGLDVNRWSVGIDTGCAYGRRLTAVVLDKNSFSAANGVASALSPHTSLIPYGDNGRARITSVSC